MFTKFKLEFVVNRTVVGKFFIGTALLIALTPPTWAQLSPSGVNFALNLSQALERADQQNTQLAAARRSLAVSQAGVTIAGFSPNPQIAVTYGFGNAYTIAGNPQQIGLAQTIELGGKRDARIALAQSQVQLTGLQIEQLRTDIRGQVRRAYAELATAEATAQAVEAQTKLVQRLRDIARKRFEAGAAPEAEVLQAQLALNQTSTLKVQAQGRIQTAQIQLNTLLGGLPQAPIEISDKGLFNLTVQTTQLVPNPRTPLPPVDDLVERAYRQRPELKGALQQIEVARGQLNLAQAQRTPDLQASAGYLFSTYSNPGVDGAPGLGGGQFGGVFVGAGVTIPIFYNQQGEVAQAEASISQGDAVLTALKQQINAEVRTAYQQVLNARDNLQRFQTRLIPDSAEVLKLAQESYQVGKTPLTNAILAQQADQQVRSGYLDTVSTYQSAYADLERALGAPLNL